MTDEAESPEERDVQIVVQLYVSLTWKEKDGSDVEQIAPAPVTLAVPESLAAQAVGTSQAQAFDVLSDVLLGGGDPVLEVVQDGVKIALLASGEEVFRADRDPDAAYYNEPADGWRSEISCLFTTDPSDLITLQITDVELAEQ